LGFSFTPEQFEDAIILDYLREDSPGGKLYLTSKVRLRWNYDKGEYRVMGKYGVMGSGDMGNLMLEQLLE